VARGGGIAHRGLLLQLALGRAGRRVGQRGVVRGDVLEEVLGGE
jgi:hypothetical protein